MAVLNQGLFPFSSSPNGDDSRRLFVFALFLTKSATMSISQVKCGAEGKIIEFSSFTADSLIGLAANCC